MGRSAKARGWGRRLGFGLALAWLSLSLVERLIDELAQGRIVAYGATCTKRYLPSCQPRVLNGTNGLHYRDDEIARPKPAGVRRVFVTGGSTTYKPIDDQGYPARLEAIFAEQPDCPRVEVLNASLDGYDVSVSTAQIRHEVADPELELGVDVVLASEQWNFLLARRYLSQEGERSVAVTLAARAVPLLKYALTARLMRDVLSDQRDDSADLYADLEATADAYMEQLRAGRRAARDAGVRYVQGLHPDRWGPDFPGPEELPRTAALGDGRVHLTDPVDSLRLKRLLEERIRRDARESGTVLVDWDRQFESLDRSRLFESDGIHPNADATLYMAQLAYEQLRPLLCGPPAGRDG